MLLGGDGTAEVGSFAAADFGPVLGLTAGSASRLIADALDLRHRLPRCWAAVQHGQGVVFHARRIASQTRNLTKAQATEVDARIAPKLGAVAGGLFGGGVGAFGVGVVDVGLQQGVKPPVGYLAMNQGGPPGQTSVDRLGPLARHSHNVRTHGRWRMRHPDPHTWVWRSPQGYVLLVNTTGSHRLGRSNYAQRIWRAANAPPFDKLRAQDDKLRAHRGQISRAEQITRSLLDACASAG